MHSHQLLTPDSEIVITFDWWPVGYEFDEFLFFKTKIWPNFELKIGKIMLCPWPNYWYMQNDIMTTFSRKQIPTNDCSLN